MVQSVFHQSVMPHWIHVFCLLAVKCAVIAGDNSVDQPYAYLTAFEGGGVTIACQYKTTNPTPSLLWYKQQENGFPEFLLIRRTYIDGNTEETQRFHSKVNSTSKTAPLTIQDLQVSDSAVYYCALISGGGFNKLIFGSGTKLLIESKVKSDPKYFKLKKGDTSACLATDFSTYNGTNEVPGFDKTEATRIDGDSYYSKAVIMSNTDSCPTGASGNCTREGGTAEMEFESVEKMNFLSLTVLGLRILFLKTIVFNVVMTCRVWMR